MSIVSRAVKYGYDRDEISGNSVDDAVRKSVKQFPSNVLTFVTNAIRERIVAQDIDGLKNFMGEIRT